ncbi:MAG: FtsQ-type POTRA domain-containing protein [Clostridia bacterium]
MRKRANIRRDAEQEMDEFQAYGEYSYDYLHRAAADEDAKPEEEQVPTPSASSSRMDTPIEPAAPQRQRQRKHGFFKVLVLLCMLTTTIVILQQMVFRLQYVYVVGNTKKTPQQVVTVSGLVRGRNIFSITVDEVKKALAKDHALIFLNMQIAYPNTIYLYINERETVAAMQWLGIGYTLDAQGLVMSEENGMALPQGLPVVTGFNVTNVNTGQMLMVRSQNQLDAYRSILSELMLQGYQSQVTEINISDPMNIYLITAEGITVRLGDSNYMQAKIGAVRTDMAYLRQLGKNSGLLDVTIPEDAKYLPDN